MSVEPLSRAESEAADWVIRQRDPAFAEWEAFADWLEADGDHAEAYHRVAAMDEDMAGLQRHAPAPLISETVPVRRSWTRRAWLSGAVAAALVGVVGYNMIPPPSDPYTIATDPGEMRSVRLADGSRIEINGGTVIGLDRERPRYAKLESGEAMFRVIHRDDDPFTVDVGQAQLVDLGTIFNVVRRPGDLSVAVSEGIVVYNPDADNVRLDAGRQMRVADGGKAKVGPVDNATVGGWRQGQLVYDGAPLSTVIEDLSRSTGVRVELDPAIASRPFTGALLIDDRDQAVKDIASLSGLRARAVGRNKGKVKGAPESWKLGRR